MHKTILITLIAALLLLSGCYTNDYSTITKEYNEKNVYKIGKNIMLGKLNDVDRQGYTMLAWAVFWNNIETARHLIEKGALVDMGLKKGNLWNLAINMRVVRQRKEVNEIGSLTEGYKITYPQLEMVRFLHEKGLKLDIKDKQGNTPLHMAISVATFSGDFAIVNYLLENKADLNATNTKNETPLQYAKEAIEQVRQTPEKYGYVEVKVLEENLGKLKEHLK